MRFALVALAVAGCLTAMIAAPASAEQVAPKPAALVADQIPDIPMDIVEDTRPYMEFRTASFVEWDPSDRSMIISTRFADTRQLH
ncbi:MAG: S9 family peptidase, partial [Parasphingorhabdus sp.]